jgi:hypothetical protein
MFCLSSAHFLQQGKAAVRAASEKISFILVLIFFNFGIGQVILEFIPEAGQEAELVDIPLYNGILAARVLEGDRVVVEIPVDDVIGDLDVLFGFGIGQVADLCVERESFYDTLLEGEVQLLDRFLPDIEVIVLGHLYDPVADVRHGQLDIQSEDGVLVQQGQIAYVIGLSCRGRL